MIHLLLGTLVVWVAGLALGHVWDWETAAKTGEAAAGPAWVLAVFPPLAAWLTAEVINLATPRRLFDRRTKAPIRKSVLGLAAGALGFVLAVVFLPIAEPYLPDWGILAASSAIGTVIPVLGLARVRRGHCVHCDYDLRTLPSMEQCPECGRTGVI